MRIWAALAMSKVNITEQIEFRVTELPILGFKDYDALHIACAEAGNADIFLTTDDRLLRLAIRRRELLQVAVENPFQWLTKVTNDRREQTDRSAD